MVAKNHKDTFFFTVRTQKERNVLFERIHFAYIYLQISFWVVLLLSVMRLLNQLFKQTSVQNDYTSVTGVILVFTCWCAGTMAALCHLDLLLLFALVLCSLFHSEEKLTSQYLWLICADLLSKSFIFCTWRACGTS